MSSFEEAKQQLMKEGSGGGNVFDHLSGVILKILSENPDDAVAQFENLSLAVKKTAFAQAEADGADGAVRRPKEELKHIATKLGPLADALLLPMKRFLISLMLISRERAIFLSLLMAPRLCIVPGF